MSLVKTLELPIRGDERGKLIPIEGGKNVPFDIKRVYYLFDTQPGVPRGFHAHKELEQVAVCLSGKCRMVLDDGVKREEVWLDSPAKAIRIEKMIWHEMHDFSSDCVLLVMASDYYDEKDYIRSYPAFLEMVNGA